MNVQLPPELDEFVSEQAQALGFASVEAYLEALINRERERESRDWKWLKDHLRPGYEAPDEEFVSSSADDVIARGQARRQNRSTNG